MGIAEKALGEFIQSELVEGGCRGLKRLEQLAMKRRIQHFNKHILWVVVISDVKYLGGDGRLLSSAYVQNLISQHIGGLQSGSKERTQRRLEEGRQWTRN